MTKLSELWREGESGDGAGVEIVHLEDGEPIRDREPEHDGDDEDPTIVIPCNGRVEHDGPCSRRDDSDEA